MAQSKSAVKERINTNLRKPRNYQVICHNDDVTTMEFVVEVLKVVFFKSEDDAIKLMMTVHVKGQAVVGVYPYDVACTKVCRATQMAVREGFPLKLTYSPE